MLIALTEIENIEVSRLTCLMYLWQTTPDLKRRTRTMTKSKLILLKNEMFLANFLAIFIGALGTEALFETTVEASVAEIWNYPIPYWINTFFSPFVFSFVCVMSLLYEIPIRHYLTTKFKGAIVSRDLEKIAQQRLLNEPFVLIALDLSIWLLAAIVYPAIHWAYGAGSDIIQSSFYHNLSIGLITVTIAFFLLEHILQKNLTPHFFPNGGLHAIPKTLRIRIRTRLVALLFACNLIPLILIILAIHRITSSHSDTLMALDQLRWVIITNAMIFILIGIFLTGLVAKNLSMPFGQIIRTLQQVRNGNYDNKIRVTSNDEIGYTGDVINEMTEGLKERERMQQSLNIAMEVQQNLLPNKDPKIHGLDIAGTSIYCEETGGDYYDYLLTGEDGNKKICVVVGDVSDHGIGSALLMTTARAFLRQRISRSGELDQVVADVNFQLTRDVEESARFMTLFICEIDRDNQIIHWVNAGHDPAMIYDRESGKFEELTGNGYALPLGVSETTPYQKFNKKIVAGQIVMMGTDGVWEAQNPTGEMFGKERYKAIIREYADQSAKDIAQAVIKQVDSFCHPLGNADDVTLVVAKIT
jgi:sigma-B regulation protein RsbU (phosphoserine phosphatase)